MAGPNVLHELVDSLPEEEIATAQRFLTIISKEPIGPEFAESIRRGLAQAEVGDTVLCRDYAEMVEKLFYQFQALCFPFTTEARMQLRAIGRSVTLHILEVLTRFGESGHGTHGDFRTRFPTPATT